MLADDQYFLKKIKDFRAYADIASPKFSSDISLIESPERSPSLSAISKDLKSKMEAMSNNDNPETAMQENSIESVDEHVANITFETGLGEHERRALRKAYFSESDGFPEPPEPICRDISCDIFYIDEDTSKFKIFKSFAQLSEYIVKAESEATRRKEEHWTDLLDKVLAFPVKNLVHYISMGEYLRYLYDSDHLTDVKIDVCGTKFLAHRVVLCCHSDYFCDLFSTGNAFSTIKHLPFEIQIKGVSAEAFATFLEFCYTGEMVVHPWIAADLLTVSDVLKVRSLKTKCEDMTKNLPIDQAVMILVKYKGSTYKTIYQNVFKRVLDQFSKATEEDEFLDADIETFCQLLASDDLVISTEYEVFRTAVRWIVHNIEDRVKYTIRIMDLVRFCYMTQDEIFSCVETTSLIRGYDKFREIVLIANWLNTAHLRSREDPFHFPEPPPRHCYSSRFDQPITPFQECVQINHTQHQTAKSPNLIKPAVTPTPSPTSTPKRPTMSPNFAKRTKSPDFAKPTMSPHFAKPVMCRTPSPSPTPKRPTMSPNFAKPTMSPHFAKPVMCRTPSPSPTPKRPTMSPNFSKPTMSPNFGKSVLAQTPSPTSTPYRPTMSPNFGKPVIVPAEIQGKTRFIPLTVDILVIGGFMTDDISENHTLVDVKGNQWVQFCKLPEPRRHHTVATVSRHLYVIGGSDPTIQRDVPIPCNSVFQMDVPTKVWKRVAAMTEVRLSHCSCTVHGKIYVIGGKGQNGLVLASMECYDPEINRWSQCKQMSTPRFAASAAQLTNKIIVAGGIGESTGVPSSMHVLRSVECYDVRENSWTTLNALRFPRCHACLVNVDERLFLCGGATRSYDYKNSVLSSVASIDEYISEGDTWCFRTQLMIPRHDAGVAVVGGRIYLIGGISTSADRVLQSIECYDPRGGIWLSGVKDLPYPARWICCASVVTKWQLTN